MSDSEEETPSVEDLLTSWGLSVYIKNFKENKITPEIFADLKDSELATLIPHIGPRIIFRRKVTPPKTEKISKNEPNKKMKRKHDEEKEISTSKKCKTDNIMFDKDLQLHLMPSIKKLMRQSKIGESILKKYEHKQLLINTDRKRIVDIIINDLSSRTDKANNVMFQEIAKKICEQFPTETVSTYYQPPISKTENNKSKPSKGRLPIKWRNLLQLTKEDKQLENVEKTNDETAAVDEDNTDEEVDDSLNWLKQNDCALIESASRHWQVTAKRRMALIEEENTPLHEIFDNFKILRQPEAYKLIDLDFQYINLTDRVLTKESWFNFIKDIFKITKENPKNDIAKNLKKIISNPDISTDSRIKAQIELLCHLIPPTVVKKKKIENEHQGKKKHKHWKVTITECIESIVQYTALPSDIEEIKRQRFQIMKDNKMTVQPYIITTGPSAMEINGFYVTINNALYKLPTMLDALNVCFQSFHVFGAKYPFESEHLWLVIQKGLFGITTKWDTIFPHTEYIIHSLTEQMDVSDDDSESNNSSYSESENESDESK